MDINPTNTVFVVLSFEGPDEYSMAGELGARVTHLPNTLADMGYQVHHFFIGDPNMEGLELRKEGNLILHRWCQWISQYHTEGVYFGEEGKLYDFTQSAPTLVVDEVVVPAIREGKLVVIMGEEWHTAEAMCRISELLSDSGIHGKTIMFWNANSTYGFEHINWQHLTSTVTITTVSRYMKQIMLQNGIDPLIIPNGIPEGLLREVDKRATSRLKEIVNIDFMLSKIARWLPTSSWEASIHVIDRLKRLGTRPVLFACGGTEPYRVRVLRKAQALGLIIRDICMDGDIEEYHRRAELEGELTPYFESVSQVGPVDIFNFLIPLPRTFLQAIYGASDVVLANSVQESFGLAGLEAMAARGMIFTDRDGKDYATHMYNSIVLDSLDAGEIDYYIDYLRANPEIGNRIRIAARDTAEHWTWKDIANILVCKLEYQAEVKGIG